MDRDHFARIITPHGSVVEIQNLTAQQAAHIEGQFAPDDDVPAPAFGTEQAPSRQRPAVAVKGRATGTRT
jgi:hypothetical protein